jgi:hypothetical protein
LPPVDVEVDTRYVKAAPVDVIFKLWTGGGVPTW